MSPRIAGIGVALPEHILEQSDAAVMAVNLVAVSGRQKQAVGALYRRTGVDFRHSVVIRSSTNGIPAQQDFFQRRETLGDLGPTTADRMRTYEQKGIELAHAASWAAVEDAQVDPLGLTHLVTATCTGFSAPGIDLELVERLPLAPSVQRTQVGFMGCHAALNALRVAQAYCLADPDAAVLVVATELCSLHFQYRADPQAIVSNSLFADGAAAVVVTSDRTNDQVDAWHLAHHASLVLPGTRDLMSWRIGDHGFEMTLSPQVPEAIAEYLPEWLDGWLASQSLSRSDIGSWAVHPGGRRILSAATESLGLTPEQIEVSREVLRQYGNMSSPTVLFILQELRRRQAALPAVMLAFGPGLTIEAALLR